MKLLSLIYTYYESPLMYQRQVEEWRKYPDNIKKGIEICVTDDCSSQNMITRPDIDIDMRVFRITKRVLWNLYAGRNIGVSNSTGRWLLLSDIDLVVSVKSIKQIWNKLGKLNEDRIYRFNRVDAITGEPRKLHGFTFLMTRDLFFRIGGYDEEYSGVYHNMCALYFKQIEQYYNRHDNLFEHLPIDLLYYDNNAIPDASKSDCFAKSKWKDDRRCALITRRKKAQGRMGTVKTLQFPYTEIV